jgi:hypothetical protein
MAYTAASPHGCAGLHGNLFAEMRDGFDRHSKDPRRPNRPRSDGIGSDNFPRQKLGQPQVKF